MNAFEIVSLMALGIFAAGAIYFIMISDKAIKGKKDDDKASK